MLTINIFNECDSKILYVKELNNYLTLSKTNYLENGIFKISKEKFLDIVKINCPEW